MTTKVLDKVIRLGNMELSEIGHRSSERLARELDRIRLHFGVEQPRWLRRTELPFKEYIKDRLSRHFYFSPLGPEANAVREVISTQFPRWSIQATREALELCGHKVALLGYGTVDLGPVIQWHRDPISGRPWPCRFWADYDPVDDPTFGDVKGIQELNRHQHLVRLAKAYFITGRERYAREVVDQLESWVSQNPLGLGINWHDSLEIALRAISWMWSLSFILESPTLTERSAERIGLSLFSQLDHVYRYPSVYFSPNTHVLGEGAALLMAGVLFDSLDSSEAWRITGEQLLFDGLEQQVLEDGMHAELSSYYHCYATDLVIQAVALCRRNGIEVPAPVTTHLEQMLEVVACLQRPDGSLPLLGDDDGGRALMLGRRDYRAFTDGLCTGAVLYDRPDFKFLAGELAEETFWFLGPQAAADFNRIEARPPSSLDAELRSAGYVVHRSGWRPLDQQLIFDCGELGWLAGGHGHADALNLTLFAAGRELLVDPGTYVYNSAPEWRDYFRSSRAHNVVEVDGEPQSLPGGTFQWRQKADASPLRSFSAPGLCYMEGEHRGYCRLAHPLVHRRRVLAVQTCYWVVLDELVGSGEHTYTWHYHFAPQADLSLPADRQVAGVLEARAELENTGLQIDLVATHAASADSVVGRTDPVQGWQSPLYGKRLPAPVLNVTAAGTAPLAAISVLTPLERDAAGALRGPWRAAAPIALTDGGAVGLRLTWDEAVEDLIVFSPAGEAMALDDLQLHGQVFWIRLRKGEPAGLLAIDARFARTRSKTLLAVDAPVCYAISPATERAGRSLSGHHHGSGR
ncbi:MAG: alginate lyase family protein [Candidatus Schekmanbacteria bacterium]|nr:alginate lyase family protein [Candidatus Schekmanbacteria bacterium]